MVILPPTQNLVVKAHPEEAVRCRAKGLPVEEIAPAANALTNEETHQHHIQHRGQPQLFHPAQHRHTGNGTQHTAIDGDTALPDIQHGNGICRILLPTEGAVIDPGADNGKGCHPQHAVQNVIFLQTELAAALTGISHSQYQSQGNGQAIIMDRQGSQVQHPSRIDFHSQKRKGNGRIIGRIHDTSSFWLG